MRVIVLTALFALVLAVPAWGEPWLDIYAVDGADSLRVEVGDLVPEDAALAIEEQSSPDAPEGSLTVIDAMGEGRVYPLIWDPLTGRLVARFPATDPPFLVGAAIRVGDRIVFVPESGLVEFPGEGD